MRTDGNQVVDGTSQVKGKSYFGTVLDSYIERDGSGNMTFRDAVVTTPIPLSELVSVGDEFTATLTVSGTATFNHNLGVTTPFVTVWVVYTGYVEYDVNDTNFIVVSVDSNNTAVSNYMPFTITIKVRFGK